MPDATHPSGEDRGSDRGRLVAFPSRHPDAYVPNNLPLQPSSFIGREKELAEVKRLLEHNRLLTLTGAGGCGKTRLALAAAGELVEGFEDGVWLVELASLSDPDLVPQTVAFTLGVREQPGRQLTETLSDHLKSEEALLVLDNCEHLVAACAGLVEVLLHTCPNVRILVTSQEALGITGETGWPVPSLSLPTSHHQPSVEELLRYEAARLFIERAAAVVPSFELTEENAAAVSRVCRGLDGMPLAIELAAARVKVLSAGQIAGRLDDRFQLLTAGSRTALPRHRTLRATIDWSHDLLSDGETILFRRLSVFAGGFALETAETICSGEELEQDQVLDLLSRLVDKSLVVMREQDAEARYGLLETVRQHGWEKLVESGEAPVVRRRHANYFFALAEEAEPRIGPRNNTADRERWLERLEVEHDNLRAALSWAGESNPEMGLRLAGALYWFWYHRGYQSEGRGWYERALSEVPAARTTARAETLSRAGYFALAQGDHLVARSRLQESVEIWRELGGRQDGLAHALWILGLEMLACNEPAQARFLTEESVEIFRTIGDEVGLAHSLANLGAIVLSQRDYALASSLLEESLGISRKIGDDWMLSLPLKNLGVAAFQQGDPGRAVALLKESLTMLRESGDKLHTSRNLECLAAVVSARGDHGLAARLFGAGEALREAIGAPVLFYLIDYDAAVAATRDALGVEAFTAAWDEGRAMTLDEAITHALEQAVTQEEGEGTHRAPVRGTSAAENDAYPGSYPDGLTAREAEVLGLLAGGRTNKQIAAELFLSVSTVQRHVANVYAKIGVHGRAEATAYALSKGLARTCPKQDRRRTTEPPG